MPSINSDKDLPKILDTPSKQVKWVKKLILKHLGSAVKRVDRPPIQGMFTRTLMLVLADGREVVQQFRSEPLDVYAFQLAQKTLGSVVPDVTALPDEDLLREGIWAYSFNRLPGKLWVHGIAGKGAEGRVAINKSLSRNLERLEELPLWITHYDDNKVNVLIDEEFNITGLIDWDLSTPLPFGVNFGRIHTYAGEYTGGEFWVPDEFEEAEKCFWNELFRGMQAGTRTKLEGQMDLIQDAVILGTLLDCLSFVDGEVIVGEFSIKALHKLLTYRIPFVRGDDPPYKG
ncbi:uncharacterized protein N7483_013011 [Penicillium malachiteum]|uniref:uncharacterized protein n=1 Tax=Penicillium malachiteum TaxID=1324776 RepID=UPI002549BFD5|nr:uncharacterized protein N7483_013011 [Penicillium malachiteum]KAJ5715830.1 hypothetical protein N7483_013011 [Penicillium malachiteum]